MFTFNNSRYNRHLQMPEWTPEKQNRIAHAKVAVIGAGGVKSSLLYALTCAGIGHIRIIDFDSVELSNLNRQFLYNTQDVNQYKAKAAATKLALLNPEIKIEPIIEKVTEDNIVNLLSDFEFIVEGGESPFGRNLVNQFCLATSTPFVHSSAQFNYGYVFSVVPKNKTACYACFYPEDINRRETTGAVPVSVLSVQIAGTLGATEVLKYFLDYENSLIVDKRLTFSSLLLSEEFRYIKQKRRKNCPICSKYYV